MKVLNINNLKYSKHSKTFHADGSKVLFDTTYKVVNPNTNKSMLFTFDHSTGSEWNPTTLWIYKGDNGITLELTNAISENHATNYLNAKLQN